MSQGKLSNVGPKSAAWLRQVGIRTQDELVAAGAVGAFMKVKRAGFKPSLNLLYALEGALLGCHWQQVPEARRAQMCAEVEELTALLPNKKGRPGPVTYSEGVSRPTDNDAADSSGMEMSFGFDDAGGGDSSGGGDGGSD
ncbi:MAG: TfoX/Sxy family protein [Aquimonas sp.]|nr:TfoX/Sxy family protein [Aquimonas sp.]